MMNRLFCKLTGGHRYSDANIRTQTMPDDRNIVEITNPCVKCGDLSVFYMNVTAQIAADMKRFNVEGAKSITIPKYTYEGD